MDKDIENNNYGEFKHTDDSRAGSTQKYPTTIMTYQKPHPSKCVHRTEKSIDMLRDIIKTYTDEGDLVLDNTCGSGTTLIASKLENRNYIGMDNGICDKKGIYNGVSWADVSIDRLNRI